LTLNLASTPIPRQIQANLIAYMRLFAGLPGMAMYDAGDAFWFVCGKPAPGNNILRARFPADHAEAQIDILFEQIGRHIHEISWLLFPGDQPADLSRRLEARGMPPGPAGIWLYADLNTLGAAPAVPPDFHIKQVRDDQMMAEWVRLSEAGFEMELPDYYPAYARHGYGPAAFSLHYTGYLGNTPVTTGTLLDAGGTAAIYDVSTPLAFRRQGFGAAITHALMQQIRNRGYADTWIWSSPLGEGVYQQLGYVPADFGIREHVWRKT
jgi:GNAT superfamily N-acetyltransferase